jgi:F-type H+-transporting ATPase subunit b
MKQYIQLWAKRLAPLAVTLAVPTLAFALDMDGHAEGHEEAAAHGGEHGEHAWDSTALVASFVNFVILIGVFVYLFRASLKKFLVERRASVEQALTEAARMKAEAEAKHREYSQRLATLDQELAQIKKDMIEAGARERDRIITEAEQKAARMRHEAEFIIDQQVKQLRNDLMAEAAEAAVAAAEALLLKTTTSYDQQRIAQEYLNALSSKTTESKAPSHNSIGTESHA